MYKRKLNQVSIFENPAMFGGITLNPENEWVKLAKMIPWWVFEKKYAEQFPSNMGQPADSVRAALGSQVPLTPPELTGLVSYINTRTVGGILPFVISAVLYAGTAFVIGVVGNAIDKKVRIAR